MDSDDEIPTLLEHTEDERLVENKKVPLTIISGFLGAGKSTLLKRILTERHGYKIAVIMNEFADTADIEARAINVSGPGEDGETASSEEFLELANGCLCCSIKDSGAAAIEKLMQRKGSFDHILLETTGLADPGPIASIFWQNEEYATGLGSDIKLDGVVCVVDAVFAKQQMQEDYAVSGIGESLRQIAAADVILLNKVDLKTPELTSYVESLIRQANPIAPIHRTIRANIDLKHIIGIDAYASRPPISTNPHSEHNDHDHDHAHEKSSTHYELRGISSLQVSTSILSEPTLERLDEWIRTVLWENHLPNEEATGSVEVLRCKGIFSTTTNKRYVLQGVRGLYEIRELEGEDALGAGDEGKLVFIGKGLDDTVRASLQSVLANES